jgi:hypothetical protein
MSVVLSSSGQVKPGRYAEFVAQAGEASKLFQRFGSAPPRLMIAGLAGEAFGAWTFSIEFDDFASFAAHTDRFAADSEAQEFNMRINDASSPTTTTSVVVASEVVVRKTKGGRGPVMAIFVTKVHPGGLERALELGGRANALAERHGAVNARLFTLFGAGSSAGQYTATWEFENMAGYAKAMDAFGSDPEGQAIAAASVAVDAPDTVVFDAIYNEVPL